MPLKIIFEGWLLKKKSKEISAFFSNDNARWFRIQEVEGADHIELALCYYGNAREKEARGWIYIKDISDIMEHQKAFTVISSSRTMTLQGITPGETKVWIDKLTEVCPSLHQKVTISVKEKHNDHIPAPSEAKASHNMDRLFSRYAMDGEKGSFYSSNPNSDPNPRSSHFPLHALSEDYGDTREIQNMDAVVATLDGRNKPPKQSNSAPSDPRHDPTHSQQQSQNSELRNSREHGLNIPSKGNMNREDHRLGTHRVGNDTTISNRLNKAIVRDSSNSATSSRSNSNSRLDTNDEEHSHRREEIRDLSHGRSRDSQHTTHQNQQPFRPKNARQVYNDRRYREQHPYSSSEEDDDDGNGHSFSRPHPSRGGYSSSENEEDGHHTPVISGDEDSEAEPIDPPFHHSNSNSARRSPPIQLEAKGSSDSRNSSGRLSQPSSGPSSTKGKPAPPPPTTAPPRRARDVLSSEATQKARQSIDEILFKKERSIDIESQPKHLSSDEDDETFDLKAECKRYSSRVNDEMANRNNGNKPPRPQNPNAMNTTSNKINTTSSHSHSNINLHTTTNTTTTNNNNNNNNMNNMNNNNRGIRAGTPPRPAGDPGNAIDKDFVTEDWDNEDDHRMKTKTNNNSNNTNNTNNTNNNSSQSRSGVSADPNWLDEKFDDD